jgi:hypothetical protein
MKPASVASVLAVLLVSGAAFAGDDGMGELISKCFHPFATFVDSHQGDAYSIGEHTKAIDGYLRYRQLDDRVRRMPYQVQVRTVDGDRMWRVLPDDEHDTGDFGPSTTCYMRQWRTLAH